MGAGSGTPHTATGGRHLGVAGTVVKLLRKGASSVNPGCCSGSAAVEGGLGTGEAQFSSAARPGLKTLCTTLLPDSQSLRSDPTRPRPITVLRRLWTLDTPTLRTSHRWSAEIQADTGPRGSPARRLLSRWTLGSAFRLGAQAGSLGEKWE
jgi:hypothetical protein